MTRQARLSRPTRALLLASLAVAAVALTAIAVDLSAINWARQWGGTGGRTSAVLGAGWASVLMAQLGGLWLWWRAPRNATGRWLWVAGVSTGLFLIGFFWPNRWGMQLTFASFAVHPALAMALLGWPTGRPDRLTRGWILWVTVASTTSALVLNLFAHDKPPPGWPRDPLAPFNSTWLTTTLGQVHAWTFTFVPAVAVAVILVRRRRRLPRGARRLLTPIAIAGVIVAMFDVFNVVVGDLAARLVWDQTAVHLTVLGAINLAQQYAQVGVAAVGLVIAFGVRRRAVRRGERRLELDLGVAAPVAAPSEALQRLVDDPTARVLYLRSDAAWVDADGRVAVIGPDHRTAIHVVAPDGIARAVIETDARVGAHPSLIEIAAATIATRLSNERVAALAQARLAEVAVLQLALLDATDAARRRLERDLHDGAQQRLVGVTLAARLVARNPEAGALDRVRSEVAQARTELVQLLDGIVPVVLSNGLAAALATLAAMTPLDVTIDVRGDLDGGDPLARTVWFIACEAAANAVKHAGGSRLHVELAVDPATTSLRMSDDGCGGVTVPPRAILQRVAEAGGTVTVWSPVQAGTNLAVVFERAMAGEAA